MKTNTTPPNERQHCRARREGLELQPLGIEIGLDCEHHSLVNVVDLTPVSVAFMNELEMDCQGGSETEKSSILPSAAFLEQQTRNTSNILMAFHHYAPGPFPLLR